MEKVTNPTVKTLATGSVLIAKQMQANAGEILPAHLANLESILLVQEGECVLNINGKDHILKQGDAFVVPPEIKHQIKVNKDFKAVHFMPKEIKFTFFK
ncbi:cupin domain-containing protein [Aequorivita sp. F47161]|uniref:Cupin domain-containing protein n=1 Tax=Aequorivita vitellina TaxID=2874475 RepID=A0A9X1U2B6_9FLAO|nr:cupin domain-containing protein [Aequorivita vitellina]MCG2418082.1 cupin domain-containing protein [Aequorivita vitellina]